MPRSFVAATASLLVAALALLSGTLDAQVTQGDPADRDQAIRSHIRALEEAHRSSLEELVERFEQSHFSEAYMAETPDEERQRVLAAVRTAAGEAGGVMASVEGDRFVVALVGARKHGVAFEVSDEPPYRIVSLAIETAEAATVELDPDDLAGSFRRLASEGMWGVAFVRLDGEVLVAEGFGTANRELGIDNSPQTVFGIGSRPIDFTVAAIHLLRQEGRLTLDDPIGRHVPDVPADKHELTLRHLMTGASGLPDFFHDERDADPDLSWVDRAEAERRILASELLFEPGTDRRHSHAAFVLLAALVERVSGQSYDAFLREQFFEPAGMERTGFYGEVGNLTLEDFAVGYGAQRVGVPNIPPNWGPTSWLIMGSGGMYSTLVDLQRFYELVCNDPRFDEELRDAFRRPTVSLDGSDRGFELFSVYDPSGDEIFVFLNRIEDRARVRALFQSLEQIAVPGG